MCLYVSIRTTNIELKNKLPRTFYKVFIKEGSCLKTPYRKYLIEGPGIVKVPDPLSRSGAKGISMLGSGAFHARTREDALKPDAFYVRFFKLGESVVVPIHVEYEDILVYGLANSVAVTAYKIKEGTWKGIFQ